MRNKLMATIYTIIFLCIVAQLAIAQQTSPTYDDKTPPAFTWGSGTGLKAQKSGTPTTNDHEIIANINVNVENTNEALGSLSIDLQKIDGSVGSISSYLNHTVGTETKSVAALLNEIANQDPNVTLGDISVDTSSIDTALADINNKLDDDLATITKGINTKIKAEDDVATDTVVSLLREIKNKEAGGDVELSETNNLISSNTEKLSTTVTYTVPNVSDGRYDASTTKSITEILAEQFGNIVNYSSYDYDSENDYYFETGSVPPMCKFLVDMASMLNELIYGMADDYLCYQKFDNEGNFIGYYYSLSSENLTERLEDGSERNNMIGVADELISGEPIQITATYSRSLTVADGLFTDKNGNPTHVLGRILQAVENGGSGSSGSSGSVDLQKIERGVGVVLNEGSESGKDEVPEMEINLVDMFYDKGTGIGDFFRGNDFAYLDEGISMYDMTKAGLFGFDMYGNVVPLLREMLQVSFSADSNRPKMADVVYNIDSKIPQNAIASISQETLSSRIHLGNIYTKLGTLDASVATLTNELITLPSKRMGITANIAIGTNAVEFGSSDYPSKTWQGCHRQFIEIISDEGDDGEFKIAFYEGGDTRNVKGRILLNIDKTQHVWISASSSSTVTVTEGWR